VVHGCTAHSCNTLSARLLFPPTRGTPTLSAISFYNTTTSFTEAQTDNMGLLQRFRVFVGLFVKVDHN